MKLDALLRAHEFLRVERPPQLWEVQTEDEQLVPLLGEMIAASLARSRGALGALTLNVSNVVVPPAAAEGPIGPPPGEFVALSVKGAVAWDADAVWLPEQPWQEATLHDLTARLGPAQARYAYIRRHAEGSITVFLARLTP